MSGDSGAIGRVELQDFAEGGFYGREDAFWIGAAPGLRYASPRPSAARLPAAKSKGAGWEREREQSGLRAVD
jgi:hypothetical protein